MLNGGAPCTNFTDGASSTLGSSNSVFCSYGGDMALGILSGDWFGARRLEAARQWQWRLKWLSNGDGLRSKRRWVFDGQKGSPGKVCIGEGHRRSTQGLLNRFSFNFGLSRKDSWSDSKMGKLSIHYDSNRNPWILGVRVLYPGYHGSPVMTQKFVYDQFPPATDG
jgi:hypothetical protein